MKTIIILILTLLTGISYSQNITNSLGTNGVFTIKGSSTDTILRMNLSNGFLGIGKNPSQQLDITKNFRLTNTVSTGTGIIFKGAERFIHNFQPEGVYGNNTFIGLSSGNLDLQNFEYYHSSHNVALGDSNLYSLTMGSNNTAIGSISMKYNTTGSSNTAIGSYTLSSNTTGGSNTATGNATMFYNTTGSYNTAVGVLSQYRQTTGNNNSALGYGSMEYNLTGHDNTGIGYLSLGNNSTGWGNTSIGSLSGINIQTGNNNLCIGYNSNPSTSSVSNQITLGNNLISSLRCNVQSITSLSDMRDKKDISDLSLGLEFITKLKPRQFRWDKREWYDNNASDGTRKEDKLTAGFIAQEMDEVQMLEQAEWLGLVNKDNPEKIEATYGNLIPVMVKAIQDLNEANIRLMKSNEDLNSELTGIKKELKKLTGEREVLTGSKP